MDKKILSIKFPHIYFESEKLRCSFGNQTVVISNTNNKTGIIIDSNNSDLTIGSFVKDININYKLLVVDYNYTNKISILIKNYLLEFSPIVEINNFKNYFIDLTGTEKLFGNIIDTSEKIMLYFKETYKFTIKMGIGSNLLVSHIASSYNTNSIYYILNEDVFLESTSIKNLPNIENKYKRIISDDYNISELRQIKNISLEDLKLMFGETGRYLYDYSNNVFRNYLIKNKVSKTTCPWGILKKEINPRINDDSEIKHLVFGLITDMCIVMREENVISNNFILKIIFEDGYENKFEKKIMSPSFFEKKLYVILLPHLKKSIKRRIKIKTIKLSFYNFVKYVHEQDLFDTNNTELHFVKTFDNIRKRYGKKSIYYI